MVNPRIEFAITFVFIGMVVIGLLLTGQIDLAFSSELETFSGPRAYPGLILSALLLLFLAIAVGQARDMRRARGPYTPFFDKRVSWSAALFASLMVFALLFERVGYILTMVPLLVLVALFCGARRPIRALFVSIGLTATCLVIFRYGLATVLPEGIFGIDAVF